MSANPMEGRPVRPSTYREGVPSTAEINALCTQRRRHDLEIRRIDRKMRDVTSRVIAGRQGRPNLPPEDVELYQGSLGIPPDFVRRHAQAIGQLQWVDDLDDRFDDPGDVKGVRWGSGTLLEGNLFLTSGHLFDQNGNMRRRPTRNGRTILPEEIARQMQVNFNFQKDEFGEEPKSVVSFPVISLLEYRVHDLDYAIVELGPGPNGVTANAKFGYLRPAAADAKVEDILCIIQHPNGRPKMIDVGRVVRCDSGVIAYVDLDTNGGSSGAPLLFPCLDERLPGEIVGVHQRGGFAKFSGSSMGVAIGAIRSVSQFL